METLFKGVVVTVDEILGAVNAFDAQYADPNDYDSWLEKRTYKYAVTHHGRFYPCNYILSQVRGFDGTEFTGGE